MSVSSSLKPALRPVETIRAWSQFFLLTSLLLFAPPLGMAAAQTAAGPAPTGGHAASDALRKLNFIDRQRMLTQMMAKSVCLADRGVEANASKQRALAARYVFDTTLTQLGDGSSGLRLQRENRPEIRAALKSLTALWTDYSDAVDGWAGGDTQTHRFANEIFSLDPGLLERVDATVGIYQAGYRDSGDLSAASAAAILLSGRQRMLTQKMSKEYCLIAAGRDAQDARARLRETIELFARTSKALAVGDSQAGLAEEPPGLVSNKIAEAEAVLSEIEPALDEAASGGTPTSEDLRVMAETSLFLLRRWEEIVTLYELLD